MIEDPKSLAAVAREALVLMHYEKVDEAISAGDATLLVDRQGEACVRGCYRCLLSYFNQPDHEMIDRTRAETKQMLVDIARGTVVLAPQRPKAVDPGSWPAAFKSAGLPAPDVEPLTLGGETLPFAWRSERVIAVASPITDSLKQAALDRGWSLYELPATVDEGLPLDLIAVFKD